MFKSIKIIAEALWISWCLPDPNDVLPPIPERFEHTDRYAPNTRYITHENPTGLPCRFHARPRESAPVQFKRKK